MAIGLPTGNNSLTILIKAKDKFSKVFAGANAKMGTMSKGLRKLGISGGMAAAGMAALAVGIGVKAVKAASAFETSMGNVATLIDESTESMEAMSKEVLDMSKEVPVSIADLTSALYDVRSAGISAGAAMDVLRSSAKLAVAGLGTTKEATNLLTSAINSFSYQGYSADEMANILFKTVKAGKTTVAELAGAFGMVAPVASEAKVQLTELQAATAALTTTGMTASMAQTAFRGAIMALQKPTADLEKIFDKLGVTTGKELIARSGGAVNAFNKIKEVAKANGVQMTDLVGRVEGLNAVLALTGGEVGKKFVEISEDMESGTDNLTVAFDKQLKTSAAQYQLMKSQLSVVMIDLGKKIIPFLLGAVQVLSKGVNLLTRGWEGNVLAMESVILKSWELANKARELRARFWAGALKEGTERQKQMRGDAEMYAEAAKLYADGQTEIATKATELMNKWIALDLEAEILRKGIDAGKTSFDEIGDSAGGAASATSDAIDKMKSKIDTLKGTVTTLRQSVIDNLKRIQDRFWGLSDEEIGALQETTDYNKEKMDIMDKGWEGLGETAAKFQREQSMEYQKYLREVVSGERRIREIRMARPITPISEVKSWAETTREFMASKVAGITGGIAPQFLGTYPRLQPVTMTPTQSVNTFNFNFEGAFIGDPEEFSKEVIDKINRASEVEELGGK